MELFLFIILSAGAIAGSLLVVMRRDPMQSAIFLIFSMLCLAGLYALLQASFIAIIQILIYAGAVMVLMLFVIMMLNLREEEMRWERKDGFWVLGIIASLVVLFEFARFLISFPTLQAQPLPDSFGTVGEIGKILFKEYLLPFELISVLLLIGIIGSVIYSRKKIKG